MFFLFKFFIRYVTVATLLLIILMKITAQAATLQSHYAAQRDQVTVTISMVPGSQQSAKIFSIEADSLDGSASSFNCLTPIPPDNSFIEVKPDNPVSTICVPRSSSGVSQKNAFRIIWRTDTGVVSQVVGEDRSGSPAGTYAIKVYDKKETGRKLVKPLMVDITTGDHNCESNCRGEPTRTPYSLALRAEQPGDIIGDPQLICQSQLCVFSAQGPILGAGTAQVVASFDVWSRPMKWTLVGNEYSPIYTEIERPGQSPDPSERTIDHGAIVTVMQPKGSSSIHLVFKLQTSQPPTEEASAINFNPLNPPTEYFSLLDQADTPDGIVIRLLVSSRFPQ
jgi:hypothetical protein